MSRCVYICIYIQIHTICRETESERERERDMRCTEGKRQAGRDREKVRKSE